MLFAATRLVLLASRVPNFLIAALRLMVVALCFLMALSWVANLPFIMLETVRIPRAVVISPDTAALKAVLVRVRMFVASRARKVAVSIKRFV